MNKIVTIPARSGKALHLARGRQLKIINTYGEQVVDTWAFNAQDVAEFLSVEHCRSHLEKLTPGIGDCVYTNLHRPILTVVEDTSPGVHDMLVSACDAERYRLLGHRGHHENCVDNLKRALKELELEAKEIPSPWNVFENVAISEGGKIQILPPPARAGDYIVLRAEMDSVVVLSACPMDILLTNGSEGETKAVAYQFL